MKKSTKIVHAALAAFVVAAGAFFAANSQATVITCQGTGLSYGRHLNICNSRAHITGERQGLSDAYVGVSILLGDPQDPTDEGWVYGTTSTGAQVPGCSANDTSLDGQSGYSPSTPGVCQSATRLAYLIQWGE